MHLSSLIHGMACQNEISGISITLTYNSVMLQGMNQRNFGV